MEYKKLIAIVEDEPDIIELVSLHLKNSGFRTKEFLNAEGFQKFLNRELPDLVILDLMLPDKDGIEVCKQLKTDKKYSSIPVIMLTARGSETDKIVGLELGADDYVTKPFSPRELVARVKAVLRRGKTEEERSIIKINDLLRIDLSKYEVYVKDKKIKLTTTEFKILEILAKKRGWVFSRDQLLDFLWGDEKIVVDRTIDVHIKHLREKLGQAGKLIQNIRGVGYKME
ncbi:MAG: response regulator [Spirochaetes bacterium]|nr:response regulator [Spirochaetota bacterium]